MQQQTGTPPIDADAPPDTAGRSARLRALADADDKLRGQAHELSAAVEAGIKAGVEPTALECWIMLRIIRQQQQVIHGVLLALSEADAATVRMVEGHTRVLEEHTRIHVRNSQIHELIGGHLAGHAEAIEELADAGPEWDTGTPSGGYPEAE